ncbi:MAG: AI-2E family transporter [Gammaproteobacteria bacterium]|nr:AI-2E family transporter [Gammaproteobacteria bacterium]MCH9763323.1 AI-2E family transporter [Gammaproteobacteria bacterium]
MSRSITFMAILVSVCLSGYLLMAGRGFLLPWVIALFIWNLLNTLNNAIQRLPVLGKHLPGVFSMLFSLLVVIGFIWGLVNIVSNNVNEVISASARYQASFKHLMGQFNQQLLSTVIANLDRLVDELNFQKILLNIYAGFTSIAGSAVLIALYVSFLFVEQTVFDAKLALLVPSANKRTVVRNLIARTVKDTQTYLGLKTLMGVLTAMASWGIMTWIGLDFAEFWALLIFFLNYIPNIGAIIATLFPALLAFIQFQTWMPFILMTSGLVTAQFIIGNIIEPRYLGRSLNLSPLVILFALGLWGIIWGVMGMFLSVPITVMMIILFAHFPTTRPIAVLLSKDGKVNMAP